MSPRTPKRLVGQASPHAMTTRSKSRSPASQASSPTPATLTGSFFVTSSSSSATTMEPKTPCPVSNIGAIPHEHLYPTIDETRSRSSSTETRRVEVVDPFPEDVNENSESSSSESHKETPEPPDDRQNICEIAVHTPHTVNNRIFELLNHPVPRPKEGKPLTKGIVYIFRDQDQSRQHRLKIGFTTDDADTRRKQIQSKCKVNLEALDYLSLEKDYSLQSPFLHPRRAERLIQKELEPWKRPYRCTRCNTLHGEWYDVSEEVAIRTVTRWVRFMHSGPYYETSQLSQFWKDRLSIMTRPRASERLEDHDIRHLRWENTLQAPAQLPPTESPNKQKLGNTNRDLTSCEDYVLVLGVRKLCL